MVAVTIILNLVAAVVMGIPACYLTHVLLLERKTSHEGPFPSSRIRVKFPEESHCCNPDGFGWNVEEHVQYAALFDHFRRLFGAYDTTDPTLWLVTKRAERFTCPTCLSFWTALPFSLFVTWALGQPFYWWPVLHLAAVTASRTYYGAIDK